MVLQKIRERAAADLQHIILPEGEDVRVVEAAAVCSRDRIAKITIIGNEEQVRSFASESGANLNGVGILDHRASHHDFGRIATLYYDLRRAKGTTLEEAEQIVKDPLYYGNLLVREGKADGSVAGATNTTAHTVSDRRAG
jgi:phosphate acetyltransferase